jgi:copper chaperone CopZ
MATNVLNVPDISCGHCQVTISGALSSIPGIDSVNVDIPTRTVTVQYDPAVVGLDQLKEVLVEEDYPVASVE